MCGYWSHINKRILQEKDQFNVHLKKKKTLIINVELERCF